jgi:hypothetical protein
MAWVGLHWVGSWFAVHFCGFCGARCCVGAHSARLFLPCRTPFRRITHTIQHALCVSIGCMGLRVDAYPLFLLRSSSAMALCLRGCGALRDLFTCHTAAAAALLLSVLAFSAHAHVAGMHANSAAALLLLFSLIRGPHTVLRPLSVHFLRTHLPAELVLVLVVECCLLSSELLSCTHCHSVSTTTVVVLLSEGL